MGAPLVLLTQRWQALTAVCLFLQLGSHGSHTQAHELHGTESRQGWVFMELLDQAGLPFTMLHHVQQYVHLFAPGR